MGSDHTNNTAHPGGRLSVVGAWDSVDVFRCNLLSSVFIVCHECPYYIHPLITVYTVSLDWPSDDLGAAWGSFPLIDASPLATSRSFSSLSWTAKAS